VRHGTNCHATTTSGRRGTARMHDDAMAASPLNSPAISRVSPFRSDLAAPHDSESSTADATRDSIHHAATLASVRGSAITAR
jgi:hypothetical protein